MSDIMDIIATAQAEDSARDIAEFRDADIKAEAELKALTTIPPEVYADAGQVLRGIMDYTLASSPYPNETLAFAGALSLMSLLCGRRYRTKSNLRTNLYIIGLGESGIGKEAARQTCKTLLGELQMWKHSADTFGSGEGLEDAMLANARLLFLYDEVDTLFSSIKNDRTGSKETMLQKILNLNGAAGSYLKRRYLSGGQTKDKSTVPEVAYHPSLSLYGTAVTASFGAVVSERMQTNGLFARCLIFDAGIRGPYNPDAEWQAPPDSLMQALKIISGYREVPTMWSENLPDWQGSGIIMMADAAAQEAMNAERVKADALHHAPGTSEGAKTLYGRVCEKIDKLAMIHSLSVAPHQPIYTIHAADIEWASKVVWPATHYALDLVKVYASESETEAVRKKILRIMSKAGGHISRRDLIRQTHLGVVEINAAIETLVEAELIAESADKSSHGRPSVSYTMRGSDYA